MMVIIHELARNASGEGEIFAGMGNPNGARGWWNGQKRSASLALFVHALLRPDAFGVDFSGAVIDALTRFIATINA
jgi:hypothetical protein